MPAKFTYLLNDRSGATAIEYGLIVALIALGILASLDSFAGAVLAMWEYVVSTFMSSI